MSGSESDSEFQSADEDSEDFASTKHSVTVQRSEIPPVDIENSQNLNITSSESEVRKTNEKEVNTPNKYITPELSNCKKSSDETAADFVGRTEEIKSADSIENNDIPECSSSEIGISSATENQPPKQRVMLRLEKKKLQKAESKESPREKPSDLINILEDLNTPKSWGFSNWGSSFISSAASSVSMFSNQVSQGLGAVLETVESTLGAPTPEELAINLQKQQEMDKITENEDNDRVDSKISLLPDMSSWTKVFEDTSSKVIAGGLDTLELIGKKTMDILSEGDPGLRKKRAAFQGDNLSQILREAKDKANMADDESLDYSQVFDEKQGLIHLEALEILSQQSQTKLQCLIIQHSRNRELKKRLNELRAICENIPTLDDIADCENFEDFDTVFKKHCLDLRIPINAESIIKTQKQINESITKSENVENHLSSKEIFQIAICCLAEFTAKCIETFHKVAELILVKSNLDQDLEQCATNLTGLTTVMCIEVNNMSSRYHKCLDAVAEVEKIINPDVNSTTMATNLYVEAANSHKYIQDAYQMLVPVLQTQLLEALD